MPAPICQPDYSAPGHYYTGPRKRALPAYSDHAHVTTKDGGLKMAKRFPKRYVPGTTVSLLSDASKMPSLSWSMPAGESCPWALYGENTICGDCYAQKGRYMMPNVANAQSVRFEWARRCMRTPAGVDEFVSTLTYAIDEVRNTYFRGHDAGDFFSPAYVRAWARICANLPMVTFWFPTRTWRVLSMKTLSDATRNAWALALSELASLPNVRLRPSALFFNAPAPRIPGMAAGTTARDEGFNCPAATQGNICGTCRVCFDEPTTEVSYHRH
jgi:hypothetical protein